MISKKVFSVQEIVPGDILQYNQEDGEFSQGMVVNQNGKGFENKILIRREVKPGIVVQEWVPLDKILCKIEENHGDDNM